MLVGGAGPGKLMNQKGLLASGVTRCLIELGLASNAPGVVKSQVKASPSHALSLFFIGAIRRNPTDKNCEARTRLFMPWPRF